MSIFAGAVPTHMPDLLSLAGQSVPVFGTALVAWLGGRYGRKARVKVGDIEIEANTAEDVEELMTKVRELRSSDPLKQNP